MIRYIAMCHTLRQLFPICQESHFLYTSGRALFFIRTLINTLIELCVSMLPGCWWPCQACLGGWLVGPTRRVPVDTAGDVLNRPLCPCRQLPPHQVMMSPTPFSSSKKKKTPPPRCHVAAPGVGRQEPPRRCPVGSASPAPQRHRAVGARGPERHRPLARKYGCLRGEHELNRLH